MERECELKSDFRLEMYTLPSQSLPINNRTVEIYLHRHNQNDLISEAAILGKNKKEFRNSEIEIIIRQVEESKRKSFIEGLLKNDDIKVRKEAVQMIWYVRERLEQKMLIEEALENDSVEVRKIAALVIDFAQESDRKALIEKALNDGGEVQKIAATMITCVQQSEQLFLREKVKEIIEKVFLSDDIKAKKEVAEMIQYVQKLDQSGLREKVKEIIEEALMGDNIENQKEAMEMIEWVDESEQELLMKMVVSKGLSNFFVESPLYKRRAISEVNFERQEFKKTGSGLTLMGGALKGKSIIRRIKPEAFLVWQKTYEDYEGWQKAGFNYVPIEPIQSYFFDEKNNLVNIFSGVLDLSLASWNNKSLLFRKELIEQRKKITDTFDLKSIKHGHLHNNNFALCFFRKRDGSVDFDKVPRIYAIDFDAATFDDKR